MKFTRCENGHYYDAEKYDTCPQCTDVHEGDILLPPGLVLFEVKNALGEGRTSKVFRIIPKWNNPLNYVLKVVDITDPKMEAMVDNEYGIARQLEGTRYFVDYYAMYKQDGKAYIVQPELRDLLTYIEEKQPNLRQVLAIVEDIAEAVMYLAGKGIVHLDIKPTNIFVDEVGNGKLGDFSTACEISSFTKAPFRTGTPKFYSPEVYEKSEYSGKEDMYSLGISIYYILSGGKYPYDFGEAETRTADSLYIPCPKIPEELQCIIRKATEYEPGARYGNMPEMYKAIHQFGQIGQKPELYYGYRPSNDYQEEDVAYTGGECLLSYDIGKFEMDLPVQIAAERDEVPDTIIQAAGAAYDDFCTAYTNVQNQHAPLEISKVHFSAIAPRTLTKADYTIIDIVMYQDEFRSVVDELMKKAEAPVQETKSGVFKVKEGARVKIQLTSPDIVIEDNVEEQEWAGEYLTYNFAVMIPRKYWKRQVLFTATVYIDDVIATRLKFVAKCWSLRRQKIKVAQENVLSAFMSYASQDRNHVVRIVQGMQKVRPDMDIFLDVESLRSGDYWEDAIKSEIDKRDTLFLCWSHHAAESPWVDKEWRYCYKRKGVEAIEPLPLEPPSECPPPKELKRKHFNDRLLYLIKEEMWKEWDDDLRW